jgi:hypothetical protein
VKEILKGLDFKFQITMYLQKHNELLQEAKKVCKTLDLICEKGMKTNADTNDFISIKMHYMSQIVRQCEKTFKSKGSLDPWIKRYGIMKTNVCTNAFIVTYRSPCRNFHGEFFFCVLHIITAVFISRHLGPVIPTSAILKKGRSPQQVTHLPPVWDLLLALA